MRVIQSARAAAKVVDMPTVVQATRGPTVVTTGARTAPWVVLWADLWTAAVAGPTAPASVATPTGLLPTGLPTALIAGAGEAS